MGKIRRMTVYRARYDKKQVKFAPFTEEKKEVKSNLQLKVEYAKPQIYYCPFCLYFGQHREFETVTKKGKPSKKIICPDCKNGMLERTLTEKMDAEQYAAWVYMYSSSGFWQKINFNQWKERLYKLGMAKKFWDKYKLLKGTGGRTESYTEHIENEAEEWAKYQNQAEQEKEQWAKEQSI